MWNSVPLAFLLPFLSTGVSIVPRTDTDKFSIVFPALALDQPRILPAIFQPRPLPLRLPRPLPRPAGRDRVLARLFMETAGPEGVGGDVRNAAAHQPAAPQHPAEPRGEVLPRPG